MPPRGWETPYAGRPPGTRWQPEVVARRRITVELESELLAAARAAAHRLGVPEDELLEQGLRQIIAPDFNRAMDEVTARQATRGISLSDDEAMALANAELAVHRADRRNAS